MNASNRHTPGRVARSIGRITSWLGRRNCRERRLTVGSIGSNPVTWCRKFTGGRGRLAEQRLECHHTVISTEVAHRRIAHRQMVQRGCRFTTLVTRHTLVWVSLQINSVHRQAIQRAEQLKSVICIEPLDHVEIWLPCAAPRALNDALFRDLEIWQALRRTKRFWRAFKLDWLNLCVIQAVHPIAVIAGADGKAVHNSESREAGIATQLICFSFEIDLLSDNCLPRANGTFGFSRGRLSSRGGLSFRSKSGFNNFNVIIVFFSFSRLPLWMLIFHEASVTTEVFAVFAFYGCCDSIGIILKIFSTIGTQLHCFLKDI